MVMIKVKKQVWVLLDIVGMILLTFGALGVMGIIPPGQHGSIALMAAGIIVIVVSSAFIQIIGSKLRKKYKEYARFDEIRKDAYLVPNDLDEGYLIDFTAEPSRAISYRKNEPKPETEEVREEEDDCDSEGGVLIVYPN